MQCEKGKIMMSNTSSIWRNQNCRIRNFVFKIKNYLINKRKLRQEKILESAKLLLNLFYSSVIILLLHSGCNSHTVSNHFVDKGRFLLRSRCIGYQKQSFVKQAVVKYNFASEKAMKDFQVVNGKWQIENGKLWAVSGKGNRSILLANNIKAPLIIEFEVSSYANPDGSIGDITILINSENSKNFFNTGYALTTGSFFNNCTTFYKFGKPIAKTEYSPLVSGKTYVVKIELAGSHLRYWLNDKIILETWDSNPLKVNPKRWIGIRTWNTKMGINYFKIYQI
jgi:hypothetical protein